jgi:transposase
VSDVYMGIDVGKNFCWVCVLDDDAECVYFERIPTLAQTCWAELLELFDGHDIHATFEVGPHYDWMYDMLMARCASVTVVAPRKKQRKKTDKIDCACLARDLWRGDLEGIFVPPDWMRRDRRLVASLHVLSSKIAGAKTRIRDMLSMARFSCTGTDISGQAVQRWIAADVLPKLEAQERLLLEFQLEQLQLFRKQRATLYKMAKQRLKNYDDAKLARSIPGFGPLVTLAILSAIGQIGRFDTPDQLASYFGLCGRVDQSGDRLVLGPITHAGNRHVRWLLGQAVTHLTKSDPKSRRRYLKLKRKKKPKVARVALMRWITTVLWRMLKNQEQFRMGGMPGVYRKRRAA